MAHYVFKSSITGKAIERASIAELEQFLAREYPDVSLDQAVLGGGEPGRSVSDLRDAAAAAGEREGESRVSSRGRRPVSQPASVRAGPARAALRRGVSAGRPVARRRQGDRPPRPRRRRPGGPGRPHHAAGRLADRASHGGPANCWTATWAFVPGGGWRPSEDFAELKLLAQCDRKGRRPGGASRPSCPRRSSFSANYRRFAASDRGTFIPAMARCSPGSSRAGQIGRPGRCSPPRVAAGVAPGSSALGLSRWNVRGP